MLVGLLASCGTAAPRWRGIAKIGLIQSFHGADAATAMAVHTTVRQRLIDANFAGGAAGLRLELVSLDDESSPRIAADRATELTLDPRVIAVLAPSTSLAAPVLVNRGARHVAVDSPAAAVAAIDRILAELAP